MAEPRPGCAGPSFVAPRGLAVMGPKFSRQIPQNGGPRLLLPQPWRRWGAVPTGEVEASPPPSGALQSGPRPLPQSAAGPLGLAGRGVPGTRQGGRGGIKAASPRGRSRGTAVISWVPKPGSPVRPLRQPRSRAPAPRPTSNPWGCRATPALLRLQTSADQTGGGGVGRGGDTKEGGGRPRRRLTEMCAAAGREVWPGLDGQTLG